MISGLTISGLALISLFDGLRPSACGLHRRGCPRVKTPQSVRPCSRRLGSSGWGQLAEGTLLLAGSSRRQASKSRSWLQFGLSLSWCVKTHNVCLFQVLMQSLSKHEAILGRCGCSLLCAIKLVLGEDKSWAYSKQQETSKQEAILAAVWALSLLAR